MNADGTGAHQIQPGDVESWARGPEWSPDGKRIVYVRWGPDEAGDGQQPLPDLWVLTEAAPGIWSNDPLVTRPGYEYLPEFSPDGRKLAYSYSKDDDGIRHKGDPPLDHEVWISDSDGSGPHERLTNLKGNNTWTQVVWAPSSDRMAITATGDLWLLDVQTRKLQLVLESAHVSFPDFAPDGRKLAVAQCFKMAACRILEVETSRPFGAKVLLDVPERAELMSDYYPLP